MAAILEIESKFDVDPDTPLPDLSQLPSVATVDAPVEHDLTATYYDTTDLTLLGSQITVRRRTGGDDAGWQVKIPAHREHARYEFHEALDGSTSQVPTWALNAVVAFVGGEPLVEVATLRTHRSIIRLRDQDGSVVASLCDDTVDAWGSPERPLALTQWREWELELAGPNDALADAGAAQLLAAGARPSSAPSKLARVLAPMRGTDAATTPTARTTGVTVADALTPYLTTQAVRLRQLDPLVRADLPDTVHQMRVAARRLRAVLLGYDRDFVAGTTAQLRKDLGWLVSELGRARDVEVLRERIRSTTAQGEGDRDLTAVDDELAASHERAHDDASTAMSSERYRALLDELAAFVSAPPWADRAHRAAAPELRSRLRRLWRQLDVAARGLHGTVGTERALRLHELRRMAKRLRYCAEAAEPQLDADARELGALLSDLQERLGRHHDAVLAERLIEASCSGGSASAAAARKQLVSEASQDDHGSLRLVRKIRHAADLRWLR